MKIKENLKQNEAITLIALIVTIVILLILAGVAIVQLNNNGLLKNTKIAKEKYTNSQKNENSIIDDYSNKIDNYEVAGNGRDTITISKEEYEELKLINRPDLWDEGQEYCWINNNKNMYGQRFIGTNVTKDQHGNNITAYNRFLIRLLNNDTGFYNVISSGGWITRDGTNTINIALGQTDYLSNHYLTSSLFCNQMVGGMELSSVINGTSIDYDIWVLYTKSE